MTYKTSLINIENLRLISEANFDDIALQLFLHHYSGNDLYRRYCDALHIDAGSVKSIEQIPFLPISFFKTHTIISTDAAPLNPETTLVFESSGTTGENTSRHYVPDAALYEHALLNGFREFYGDPAQYAILALLPSYLERKNASLVHMAKVLMAHSGHKDNGFYINEWESLHSKILKLEGEGQKILLLGVTFALLDFADAYTMRLQHTIVMETGGMKGRRVEMTRNEVHDTLKRQWQLDNIHSEYGMTELLSQAYAVSGGIFKPTATMKVFVRDINDPLEVMSAGNGAINIIDLANFYSCPFIATEDIGTLYADGSFEVLGRMDHSILRGCSQMVV